MKAYRGKVMDGEDVVVTRPDGSELPPVSAPGFAWGYHGAAPLRLAFALLLDAGVSEDRADELHQVFMDEVVSRWDWIRGTKSWELPVDVLRAWVSAKDRHATSEK